MITQISGIGRSKFIRLKGPPMSIFIAAACEEKGCFQIRRHVHTVSRDSIMLGDSTMKNITKG